MATEEQETEKPNLQKCITLNVSIHRLFIQIHVADSRKKIEGCRVPTRPRFGKMERSLLTFSQEAAYIQTTLGNLIMPSTLAHAWHSVH